MATALFGDLSDEEIEPILPGAIRDSYMPVRREAFQQCLRRDPALGLRWAEELLFDRSSAVREIAIVRLKAIGFDVERALTNVLLSIDQPVQKCCAALTGLAMIKATSRTELVKSFCTHVAPSVRRAALQAISWLDEGAARSLLLSALAEPSPGVAKEAARLLNRCSSRPLLFELLSVLENSEFNHTSRACFVSSGWLSKWDRLIFVLEFMKRTPKLAEDEALIQSELSKWEESFNRSATQPTLEQCERIAGLYRLHAHSIPEWRRRSFEFTLAGVGIQVR